jgi:hypothetical protein
MQKIQEVEAEIERFQKIVFRLRELRSKGRLYSEYLDEDGLPYLNDFPAETGAIRRASMDLTRVLARLRSSKD